jgi:hypothetical protein
MSRRAQILSRRKREREKRLGMHAVVGEGGGRVGQIGRKNERKKEGKKDKKERKKER